MEPRNNPGINISCRSHMYFRSKYTSLTCFASLCCFISAVVVRGILVEDDLDAVLPHLAGLLLVLKVAGLVAHSPPVARVVAQQRVRRGVVRVVRGRVSSSWRRRFRAWTSTVHPLLLLLFQARPNRLPCLFDVDLGHLEQVDLSQVPTVFKAPRISCEGPATTAPTGTSRRPRPKKAELEVLAVPRCPGTRGWPLASAPPPISHLLLPKLSPRESVSTGRRAS